jgi:hypothetical protein
MISATISLLICAATFAEAVPDGRVPVFVAPLVSDGVRHVDPGIASSVKDIEDELRRSGLFTVAASSERAVLTLVVVARHASGPGQAVGGVTALAGTMRGGNAQGVQQPSIQMPSLTAAVPVKGRVLETKLRVAGTEDTFLSGDGSESWRYTARQVVKDLAAWVKANPDSIPEVAPTSK